MKILLRLIILFAIFFTAINGSHAMGQFFFFENPLIGESAPDFTLNTIRQQKVNLTQFREGKPAIVFFWATWCPHCRVQLKEIKKNKNVFQEKGIKIVLIDLGENAKQVESYMTKNGIDLDVFLDEDSSVSNEYGVIGIPTFILIDKDGIVKAIEYEIPKNFESILLPPPTQSARIDS